MPYEMKTGNGGNGPEVYDTNTGKYASISFSYEGNEIKGWEDLKEIVLKSNPEWQKAYNENPQVKEQFDEAIKNQMYAELLNEEVNRLNYEEGSTIDFSDAEDATNNFEKLFSDKIIDTLLANDGFERNLISVNPYKPDYQVSILSASLQMCRYKNNVNNRMKPITGMEFLSRLSNVKGSFNRYDGEQALEYYLENNDYVPINRNMGIPNESVWKEVKRSYWDENSKIESLLSRPGGKNVSYFGSVIYTSVGNASYGYGIHSIEGLARTKGSKIAYCPIPYSGNDEINKLMNNIKINKGGVLDRLKKRFIESGKVNENQAKKIINELIAKSGPDRETIDVGFYAMVLGYDAIAGAEYQLDILNPSIVDVVYDD